LYTNLDANVEEDLRIIIASLPEAQEERNEYLVKKISALNPILEKVAYSYSHSLYRSLKEFAHYIANVDGGFWGMGSVKQSEEAFLTLDMLNEPQKPE